MLNHQATGALQFLLHTGIALIAHNNHVVVLRDTCTVLSIGYFNETERAEAIAFHQEIQKRLEELCPFRSSPVVTIGHGAQWGSMETLDYDFYASTQTMNSSGPNRRGKYKSAFMLKNFPALQIDKIMTHLTTIPLGLTADDMKSSLLQVDCFGGQINEVAPTATATPHRRHVWKLQYQTYWTDITKDEAHLTWIRNFYNDMYEPYGGVPNPLHDSGLFEGCYYNYPDVDLNDIVGKDAAMYLYFMENTQKLSEVKKYWDSANYFTHAQSIPISYDTEAVEAQLTALGNK